MTPGQDTLLTVVVGDGCSNPAQSSAFIRVHPLPSTQFLPQQVNGCAPLMASFTGASGVPPGSTYAWTFGDGTTSTQPSAMHLYPQPGQYSVSLTIRTPQGCSSQLIVPQAVKVFAVPDANFGLPAPRITLQQPLVNFTDLSQGANAWSWDFGDNTPISHVRHPSHTYLDTGLYTITLIVQGPGGCLDTIYRTLRIDEEFNVYIPNAFTPNDDGHNDGFIAVGTGITGMDMWIFDRWGVMLYSSTGTPWNGRMHNTGEPCMQDVYVYKIRVYDPKHVAHEYIGKVTLVR